MLRNEKENLSETTNLIRLLQVVGQARRNVLPVRQVPPIHPILLAVDGLHDPSDTTELINELHSMLDEAIEDVEKLTWTATVAGFREQVQYFADHQAYYEELADLATQSAQHTKREVSRFVLAASMVDQPNRLEGLTLSEVTVGLHQYMVAPDDEPLDTQSFRDLREAIKEILGSNLFFIDDSVKPVKIWLKSDFTRLFPEDQRLKMVKKRRRILMD